VTDTTEALLPLERTLEDLRELDEKAAELRADRANRVRELLTAGYSAAELGRLLDVSGERVRQWAGAGS